MHITLITLIMDSVVDLIRYPHHRFLSHRYNNIPVTVIVNEEIFIFVTIRLQVRHHSGLTFQGENRH